MKVFSVTDDRLVIYPALEEIVSRKTELFLRAKQVLRAHPGFTDQELADHIGARLVEAEEIIREARKDVAADTMETS